MAASHDAEAVMLDFVEPARPGRRRLRGRWQTRFDNAQLWAGTLTQRHNSRRYKSLMRAMQSFEKRAPAGGLSDRGGRRFRPACCIKSAISGVRMGHLSPHGGVAMASSK
jgi:hypothetical protein